MRKKLAARTAMARAEGGMDDYFFAAFFVAFFADFFAAFLVAFFAAFLVAFFAAFFVAIGILPFVCFFSPMTGSASSDAASATGPSPALRRRNSSTLRAIAHVSSGMPVPVTAEIAWNSRPSLRAWRRSRSTFAGFAASILLAARSRG